MSCKGGAGLQGKIQPTRMTAVFNVSLSVRHDQTLKSHTSASPHGSKWPGPDLEADSDSASEELQAVVSKR